MQLKQAVATYSIIVLFALLVTSSALAGNNYVDNGDGTVTDRSTRLIWEKENSAGKLDWKQALASCEQLEKGGKTDWRLPSLRELESLADFSRNAPAIDPVFVETGEMRWTSTTFAGGSVFAWNVDFAYGGTYHNALKEYKNSVRCVRGAQQD